MKYLFVILFVSLLTACQSKPSQPAATDNFDYHIHAQISLDSTLLSSPLVLLSDQHTKLVVDTVLRSPQGEVTFDGRTVGSCEVYLCTEGMELCRFFVLGGMTVDLALSMEGGAPVATYHYTATDSLNPWLSSTLQALQLLSVAQRKQTVDSLVKRYPQHLSSTLLLREVIPLVDDSVFVRRALGTLQDEAKPDWVIKSIDDRLAARSLATSTTRSRIRNAVFTCADSTTLNLDDARSEYLLLCFWSAAVPASVDTLRAYTHLMQKDLANKRVSLLSCCVYAKDSAQWLQTVRTLAGRHTLLPAGFATPSLSQWGIRTLPDVVLCDMYGNVFYHQASEVRPLKDEYRRIPNKISNVPSL